MVQTKNSLSLCCLTLTLLLILNFHSVASTGLNFTELSGQGNYYPDINAKSKKEEILDSIRDGSYNKYSRPLGINGSGPVEVGISIRIMSIENLDDVAMEYTVRINFHQEWFDPRLQFDPIQDNMRIKYLQVLDSSGIWIWTPDLIFNNEKKGEIHQLMYPNKYVRIFPSGYVLMTARVTILLACPMDLHYYPMDSQYCKIQMESMGYTTEDILLKWAAENSVEIDQGIHFSRFKLVSFSNTTCELIVTRTGAYDCLELILQFERQFGYYLIQIYAPCIMLVVVSWVQFWLDPSNVEARVSLCVTSILAVVTQAYGINQTVPPASYVKAIDVWLFAIQFMVFADILEFAYVNYMMKYHWRRALRCFVLAEGEGKDMTEIRENEKRAAEVKAKLVDSYCKIIFPAVFGIFNVVYWGYYLNPNLKDTSNHTFYLP